MDYVHRTRLKILGRARMVELDQDPALIAQLALPDYRARVERGILITVEAFGWNCPQHTTPRFTEAERAPLLAELEQSRQQVKQQAAH